jgi:hypothetical protein
MTIVTYYRIERWTGEAWQLLGYEYESEEQATSELHELCRSDKTSIFRLLKCTYEALAMRAFLTEIPEEGATP